MSFKSSDVTREELEKLVALHKLKPELISQNPYIANGLECEILACRKPNGNYDVQLLDKKEVEESVEKTIRIFMDFANAAKS